MQIKKSFINRSTRYAVILILASILVSLFSVFGFIYNAFDENTDDSSLYIGNEDLRETENNISSTNSLLLLMPQSMIALCWVSVGFVGNAIKEQSNYGFANILSDPFDFKSKVHFLSDVSTNFNLMISEQVFKLRISRLKAG